MITSFKDEPDPLIIYTWKVPRHKDVRLYDFYYGHQYLIIDIDYNSLTAMVKCLDNSIGLQLPWEFIYSQMRDIEKIPDRFDDMDL